ncbi:MAG: sigE 9 [Gemmataceae bacterium]|nr:sigE 9 [Gemmataceae bacterium]
MKEPSVNPYGVSTARTSLTLLDKARRNDKDAWDQLVSLYTPLVYHWCKLAGLQRPDAEEVGQEVFLAVARGLGTFTHDRAGATFRGWLRVITRREILDHAAPPGGVGAGGSTAQQLLAEIATLDPAEDGDPDAQAAEKNILYHRAIELMESCFEPKTCRAFWLQIAGRTAKEVAAELRMSPTAVYTAKSRILSRLRAEFGDLLDLGPASAPGDLGE